MLHQTDPTDPTNDPTNPTNPSQPRRDNTQRTDQVVAVFNPTNFTFLSPTEAHALLPALAPIPLNLVTWNDVSPLEFPAVVARQNHSLALSRFDHPFRLPSHSTGPDFVKALVAFDQQ